MYPTFETSKYSMTNFQSSNYWLLVLRQDDFSDETISKMVKDGLVVVVSVFTTDSINFQTKATG